MQRVAIVEILKASVRETKDCAQSQSLCVFAFIVVALCQETKSNNKKVKSW